MFVFDSTYTFIVMISFVILQSTGKPHLHITCKK
nr:MAG TPA: hypothetical protein [Caudoviricetes sp.]